MTDGCPGIHRLERFHAGDRDPATAAHVGACAACRARLEEIAADERALLARLPPAALAERAAERAGRAPRRAPSGWVLRFLAPAAAVAAAVLAVVVLGTGGPPPPPGPNGGPDHTTLKGGAGAELYVARAEGPVRAHSGDAFHAGDRLRLRLVQPPDGYLFVFSVDAAGGVFPGVAGPEGRGLPIAAQDVIEPPGSVVLDAATADERLYAVVLAAPRAWDGLAAEVGAALAARPAGTSPAAVEALALDGALFQASFLLRREP